MLCPLRYQLINLHYRWCTWLSVKAPCNRTGKETITTIRAKITRSVLITARFLMWGWPYVILYTFVGKVWSLLLPYSPQQVSIDGYILHNLRFAALKQNITEKPHAVCVWDYLVPQNPTHSTLQQQRQKKENSINLNQPRQRKHKPWRRVHNKSFVGKVLIHFLLPYSPQQAEKKKILLPSDSMHHDLQHWSLILSRKNINSGEIIYALRQ